MDLRRVRVRRLCIPARGARPGRGWRRRFRSYGWGGQNRVSEEGFYEDKFFEEK